MKKCEFVTTNIYQKIYRYFQYINISVPSLVVGEYIEAILWGDLMCVGNSVLVFHQNMSYFDLSVLVSWNFCFYCILYKKKKKGELMFDENSCTELKVSWIIGSMFIKTCGIVLFTKLIQITFVQKFEWMTL